MSYYDTKTVLLRIASRVPHLRLAVMAALVGAAAGAAAWLLLHLIGLFTNLFLFHQWGWDVPSFSELQPSPWIVVAAVCGAGVVTLMARWAPVIRGHGIPEAMEAVLVRQSRISPRTAVAKPLSSAIAIGTGGPFGAEGPIIVTGGALGSLLGQLVHVSANERKILLASGAAAGMAATFGTPLAAVVLAIELLLFEFSTRALVPLVVATSVAAAVHAALYGTGPLFAVPTHDFAGLAQFPWYALLGIGCGLLATLIAKGLFAVEHGIPPAAGRRGVAPDHRGADLGADRPAGATRARRRLRRHRRRPGRAPGGGHAGHPRHRQARGVVDRPGVGHLGRHAGADPADQLVQRGARRRRAAPLRAGRVADHVRPGGDGGHVRGRHAGAVRGDRVRVRADPRLRRHPPADGRHRARRHDRPVAAAGEPDDREARPPTRQRPRRVPARRDVHDTGERQIMAIDVAAMPATSTVRDALDLVSARPHGAYPVNDDDGLCIGVVSRAALLESEPTSKVAELVDDVVSVTPDDAAIVVLQRIMEEAVDHVPVLVGGRVVGMCTRTDLLRARHAAAAADETQKGWLSRRRRPIETAGEADPPPHPDLS